MVYSASKMSNFDSIIYDFKNVLAFWIKRCPHFLQKAVLSLQFRSQSTQWTRLSNTIYLQNIINITSVHVINEALQFIKQQKTTLRAKEALFYFNSSLFPRIWKIYIFHTCIFVNFFSQSQFFYAVYLNFMQILS